MYSLIQLKTFVSCGRDPARSLPLRRGFLLIPLILVCFAFLPQTQAAPVPDPLGTPLPKYPSPDGCYAAFTTAEGCNALHSLTTGQGNTGVGWYSLWADQLGSFNTGLGAGTLVLNKTDDSNTATGAAALLLNGGLDGHGTQNCAYGTDALLFNGFGVSNANYNDAFGAFALFYNTDGYSNNAVGNHALFENVHGAGNTAVGDLALQNNDMDGPNPTTANINTAVGAQALLANVDGDSNNAVGYSALENLIDGVQNNAMGAFALASNNGAANTVVGDSAFINAVTGAFNTVIGWHAGAGKSTGGTIDGNDNIYIGATAGPTAAENSSIRIGDPGFITGCWIAGITGVPVTGDLVTVDSTGKLGVDPAGISMKGLLKDHQTVKELAATTEKQQATIALQEGQIKALTASLREQADQIQKVSAQLEMIRPAPRVVGNR